MTNHSRLPLGITARALFALVVVASALTGCDGGEPEAPDFMLAAAASGRNSLPDFDPGLGRELPEADGLDREIPGIAVLVDPVLAAEPAPEPQEPAPEPTVAPPPEPAPITAPQPEPTTTLPQEPAPEPATTVPQEPAPAPATAAPPPEPEPEAAVECEGYRVEDLLFESGSAEIAEAAAASFEALVALIPAEAEVVVVGHTDSVPASMGNQKLSEMRAQAVADAMIEAGLPTWSIVDVFGRADTEPVATNETADGRTQNRRVEVFVNCPIDAA